MSRQIEKSKLILENLINGDVLDLGSEGELKEVHNYIKINHKGKTIGLDIEGDPDIKADLNKEIPLKNNSIENIVAGDLIEHLESPLDFLKECYRILISGGRLIITTPNSKSFNYFLRKEGHWKNHLYAWDMFMLEKIIRKAGFTIIKKTYFNAFRNRFLFLKLVTTLMENRKSHIMIVSSKTS